MNSENDKTRRIARATLEATFKAQEKLRKHLDILITENRSITDEKEKDLFYRELVYSTFGLGKDVIMKLNVKGKKGEFATVFRKDVETVGRWLADQNSNLVDVPLQINSGRSDEILQDVEIGVLWKAFKDQLFTVFPLAIERATNLSREQDSKKHTKGYTI